MGRKWLVIPVLLLGGILFWYLTGDDTPPPSAQPEPKTPAAAVAAAPAPAKEEVWVAPDSTSIPRNREGELIAYGKKLIQQTAHYFGPRGIIGKNSNGMNCQNCHLEGGTKAWAGNFGSVESMYPRFSERRGHHESIHQRITDCFERSMNGTAPDSNSLEMRAMKAYIRWVGKDVPKGKKPLGTGLEILPYISRAADPEKGRLLYMEKCRVCHGLNGEGQPNKGGAGYLYPPLWGAHSYNVSAGIYRLSKFAGFVKDNMPYGSNYLNEQLSTEDAWDVAAFVNSQPRPNKRFRKDWPDINIKPVDVPVGPYADSFPADQHKYGPFEPIARAKKQREGKN